MRSVTDTPSTIDAYIAGFPPAVQARLHAVRFRQRGSQRARQRVERGIGNPPVTIHDEIGIAAPRHRGE